MEERNSRSSLAGPAAIRAVLLNRFPLSLLGIALCAMLLGACGDSGPSLSATAEQGRSIAEASGCVACHGRDGQGSAGPAWIGLADSERPLSDGTTVVADTTYLRRSIRQPEADEVSGYTIKMPSNSLSDEEVEAVVAYILELK